MSRSQKIPLITLLLGSLTFVVSLYVSWAVNGTLLSKVRIVDLAEHGGVRFADMRELKLWRYFTAQLVHVKWPHMLFNVACLFGIGSLVENRIGGLKTLGVWGIAGGIATLISPVLIAPPYDVGTGASHAVLAFAGCALMLVNFRNGQDRLLKIMIVICVLPAFALDFVFAGYPKPGHVAALVLGAVLGWIFRRKSASF